jgi:hypothetical protein
MLAFFVRLAASQWFARRPVFFQLHAPHTFLVGWPPCCTRAGDFDVPQDAQDAVEDVMRKVGVADVSQLRLMA